MPTQNDANSSVGHVSSVAPSTSEVETPVLHDFPRNPITWTDVLARQCDNCVHLTYYRVTPNRALCLNCQAAIRKAERGQ